MLTKILLASWLTMSAADAGTTYIGLQEGARETNPLMGRSAWAMPVVKATSATTMVWFTSSYQKKHPKLVRAIAIGATVGYAALTVHNVGVIREQRRINQGRR